MVFEKGVAQELAVYAWDSVNAEPKTGDAANITAKIVKDNGTVNSTDDANPTEKDATNMKGWYYFNITAAEAGCDALWLQAVSSSTGINIDPVVVYPQRVYGFKKNTAYSNFQFVMWLEARPKATATGKTVAVYVQKDGAAAVAADNSPATEVGGGTYKINLTANDLNADVVTISATNSDCIPKFITFETN